MGYMNFIAPQFKAIAAFIAGLIVTPLTVFGITPETPIETAITILLVALFNYALVRLSPKDRQ